MPRLAVPRLRQWLFQVCLISKRVQVDARRTTDPLILELCFPRQCRQVVRRMRSWHHLHRLPYLYLSDPRSCLLQELRSYPPLVALSALFHRQQHRVLLLNSRLNYSNSNSNSDSFRRPIHNVCLPSQRLLPLVLVERSLRRHLDLRPWPALELQDNEYLSFLALEGSHRLAI